MKSIQNCHLTGSSPGHFWRLFKKYIGVINHADFKNDIHFFLRWIFDCEINYLIVKSIQNCLLTGLSKMIFGNCLNNIYKGNQLCWFQKWYAFFSKMNIWLRNEFIKCFDCEINYLMWNQSKTSNIVFFITLKFSGWFCVGANLLF